ncbi:eukaryotic translation initiation factor 4 gamma 3-like [Artemia franciscana]|uniref:eukaryotic translation initiation factor 4 gamma 3-like n=1 Tax=Artemia franciscana TaxID=6661 RepID=UPI0032DA6E23
MIFRSLAISFSVACAGVSIWYSVRKCRQFNPKSSLVTVEDVSVLLPVSENKRVEVSFSPVLISDIPSNTVTPIDNVPAIVIEPFGVPEISIAAPEVLVSKPLSINDEQDIEDKKEEPAPKIDIEEPCLVSLEDIKSPLPENEETEGSSRPVLNNKISSKLVTTVVSVDLLVPAVVAEPLPAPETSFAEPEIAIQEPKNTNLEPDTGKEKESDFSGDSMLKLPVPEIKQQETSSVRLLYAYEEGQWSPLNPGGKRRYDRGFLKKIQDSPLAQISPNIPAEIFKQRDNQNQRQNQVPNRCDNVGAELRSPMQEDRTPIVINVPVAQSCCNGKFSVTATQKLEKAWVPRNIAKQKVIDLEEQKKVPDLEEQKTIDLKYSIRGKLNKLTPENFEKVSKDIWAIEVDTEERLRAIVQIFFDKVVDEQLYAPQYAELCKGMLEKDVPSASGPAKIGFQEVLLDRCLENLEKWKQEEEAIISIKKAVQEADTEEKQKKIQSELNDKEAKTKAFLLGNSKFIGELYILEMVSEKTLNDCISKLLKSRNEEELKCLCKLISTIGKTYEGKYRTKLDECLDEMKNLSQNRDLSTDIRSLIMDVLDLKKNEWMPRKQEEGPKIGFQEVLIDRCLENLEKWKQEEEAIISIKKAVQEADTEEKQKKIQSELNDKEAKTKAFLLGNSEFIGELFILEMVSEKTLNDCISKLLKSRNEEELKCLCKLISTIGKTYEGKYRTKLDECLDEMKNLSQNRDLSTNIQFLIMDVLDLKKNEWMPRKQEEGPKKIAEIRGEAPKEGLKREQKERLEEEVFQQVSITKQRQMDNPPQRRDGKRGDDTKKSRSAVHDESWQTYQGKRGLGRKEIGPADRWSKRAGLASTAVQTSGGRYSVLRELQNCDKYYCKSY